MHSATVSACFLKVKCLLYLLEINKGKQNLRGLLTQKTIESDFFLSFSMKVKNDDNNSRGQTVDITVYEYFAKHWHRADLICLSSMS